jgi:hypothetical protein
MANDPKYDALEKKLNSDPALRSAFVKDPAAVLTQQGVALTPAMTSAVHSQIAALKIPDHPPAGFQFPHIHIVIQISITKD